MNGKLRTARVTLVGEPAEVARDLFGFNLRDADVAGWFLAGFTAFILSGTKG